MELNARDKYPMKNIEIRISSEILTKKNCVEMNNIQKIIMCLCIIKD